MKGLKCSIVALLLAFTLSGCAAMAVQPATGFLYSDVKAGMTATSNVGTSKVGTAMAQSILGLICTGDASIEAACKNGGIKRIHHVDYHSKCILGLYAEYTVYVYGE